MHQARSPKVVGHGWEEYRRVVVATFRVFAIMAIVSRAPDGRLAPLPRDGCSRWACRPAVERKLARVSLHRARVRGEAAEKVLVIGGERSAGRARRRGSLSTRLPATTCAASGFPTKVSRWLQSPGSAPRGVPVMSSGAGLRARPFRGPALPRSWLPTPSISGTSRYATLRGSSRGQTSTSSCRPMSSTCRRPPLPAGRLGHAHAPRQRAAVRRRSSTQQAPLRHCWRIDPAAWLRPASSSPRDRGQGLEPGRGSSTGRSGLAATANASG